MGVILAITAACCYAGSAVLARVGLSTGIKPSSGTFISMISSVLLVGVLVLIINFKDIIGLSLNAVLWFGLIGIITYFIGRQANYAAIRRIGAARASPLFSTASFFALILAVSFLGESVNIPIIIGTLTIMTGLYLVVTSR
jgi:drug/metabolite transporter (DMT)-like permease